MVLTRETIREIMVDSSHWLQAAQGEGATALIDKEENWTSFDCVAKLRSLTKVKRVGHAGTLDPLATGLLIVCFGKATKTIESIQDAPKTYDVCVRLGATTSTDDRGAEETHPASDEQLNAITADAIHEALKTFTGTIEQIPPAFSAIRHNGRRQYDLARTGAEFTPRPRIVTVHSISDVKVQMPYVHMSIHCSKGTYIRSIARDLGAMLGVGGYAWSLRRSRIGDYDVAHALTVSEIRAALVPVETT